MNKLYPVQKFTPIGAAVFGVFASIGIAITPVQAATVTNGDTAGWGDGTSDFFDDVGLDTFSIDLTQGLFLLNPSGTGIFEDFELGDPLLPASQFPITATFNLIEGTGTVPDPFRYELVDNDITFTLGISGDAVDPITYTQPVGSIFDFIKDGVETQGELDLGSDQKGFYTIDGIDYSANEAFQFNDLSGVGPGGEYDADAEVAFSVPEPASVFGFFLLGSLGLGLKRKK